jgi:hypothetical protein
VAKVSITSRNKVSQAPMRAETLLKSRIPLGMQMYTFANAENTGNFPFKTTH